MMTTVSSIFTQAKDAFQYTCAALSVAQELTVPLVQDAAVSAKVFSQSVAGQKGIGFVSKTAGGFAGAAFPEETLAYRAGTSLSGRKVIGAVAAVATGCVKYSFGLPAAALWPVVSAATIAGGMSGVELAGQQVPDHHIARTMSSNVASAAVDGLVSVLPIPVPGLGSGVGAIASLAAYYAPETAEKYFNPVSLEEYHPAKIVREITTGSAAGVTNTLGLSALQGLVSEDKKAGFITQLNSMATALITNVIDKDVAANALVRAVNDHTQIIQKDPALQEEIKASLSCTNSLQKEARKTALKKKLVLQALRMAYGNEVSENVADAFISQLSARPGYRGLFEKITAWVQQKEAEVLGFSVYSKSNEERLDIYMPALVMLILIHAVREHKQAQALTKDEMSAFYTNLVGILFSPYGRALSWVADKALPWVQSVVNPSSLAEMARELLKKALKVPQGALVNAVAPLSEQKLMDPGVFVTNVTHEVAGNPKAFAQQMFDGFALMPFIKKMASGILFQIIKSKLGVNAIVRAFNDYVSKVPGAEITEKVEQLKAWERNIETFKNGVHSCFESGFKLDDFDSENQEKIRAYVLEKDPGVKRKLKDEIVQLFVEKERGRLVSEISDVIMNHVWKDFRHVNGDTGIAKLTMDQVNGQKKLLTSEIDRLVKIVKDKERSIGDLSDEQMMKNKLAFYLPALMVLIAVHAKNGVLNQPLENAQLETFYNNIQQVVLSPYEETMFVKEALGLISLPALMTENGFVPDILHKMTVEALAPAGEGIIALDDEERIPLTEQTSSIVHSGFRGVLVSLIGFIKAAWIFVATRVGNLISPTLSVRPRRKKPRVPPLNRLWKGRAAYKRSVVKKITQRQWVPIVVRGAAF
jgi:hypothetical protein